MSPMPSWGYLHSLLRREGLFLGDRDAVVTQFEMGYQKIR